MPTIHIVTEKFPGGFNAIPHNTLEGAIKTFKQLVVNSLDPDESATKKKLDKAVNAKYWSTCEGDYEQEIIIQIQTTTVKD